MDEQQMNELSKQGEARLEEIAGVNESETGYDGPEEPESEGEVLAEEEATEQE